jgi:hypothetical protein
VKESPSAGSGRGTFCCSPKVLLFYENQTKIEKWKGIGLLFVENTQTLFEKSKTDVQGAENPDMKQIDMAQSTKCDKIKPDMRSCVHDTDRKQQ